MKLNKSILVCSLVILAVVAKETRIQGNGTEKDNTCIQQGNWEWEGTSGDHDLYNAEQVYDEDKVNMNRSLFGFYQFDFSNLKTNDAGQPRYPETNDAGQPRYPEAEDAVLPTYEYPTLTRRDPGKVGDTQEVEYSPGKVLKLITLAVQPPIFEVPELLTPEECDIIIQLAKNAGLKRSRVNGINIDEEFRTKNIADVFRVSDQAVLKMAELGDLGASILNRLLVIKKGDISMSIWIASYEEEEDQSHIPCCFQMNNCGHVAYTPNWETCCRMCRYITVMYYLSDVPAGGETAFPLADIPENIYQATLKEEDFLWYNLSYYCYNASFILRPKKGTAIMWYNHHVDPE